MSRNLKITSFIFVDMRSPLPSNDAGGVGGGEGKERDRSEKKGREERRCEDEAREKRKQLNGN